MPEHSLPHHDIWDRLAQHQQRLFSPQYNEQFQHTHPVVPDHVTLERLQAEEEEKAEHLALIEEIKRQQRAEGLL